MEFLQNITFRRTRTMSDSNTKYNNDYEPNETLDCSSVESLPDNNNKYSDESVASLKERIEKLMFDLNNAHKKIELLSVENGNLKQINEDLLKLNDSSKTNFYRKSSRKQSKNNTPTKKEQREDKETQSSEKLTTNMVPDDKAITEYTIKKQESKQFEKEKHSKKTRKLCIINGCNYNGTLNIIERTFGEKFNYCQFMKRNSSLKELMSGMKNKLCNFDEEDYCIVMIGEREFRNNVNSIELVKFIRETLIEITKTNVILCTPTYVLGAPIYNYRVEMFNDLLCEDIEKYKYAYFFDTNYDLTYDMLSNRTGKINRSGIKCIFGSIFNRILVDLENDLNTPAVVTTDNNKQNNFFRDI